MSWNTRDDGSVEVDGSVPELSEPARSTMIERVCRRWGAAARAAGAKYGVPESWILGMIWAESGGDPTAQSPDGGLGLMQLTHPSTYAPHSRAAAMEPGLNIELGARTITSFARTPRATDLPAVASRYNAGGRADGSPHPSPASPWGYRETPGHIDRVVRASNTAIAWCARQVRTHASKGDGSGGGTLALLIGVLWWLA